MRAALSKALRDGSDLAASLAGCLVAQSDVVMSVPCTIGDYTDFYTGIHHATTVGKLFRPDQPLLPNYKWVPIGYHGRSSSIGVSGMSFPRPLGQFKTDADAPQFGPSRRLDYELELGAFIGPGNALGEPVPIARAEDRLFGVTLLNDWSARDIQAWEYQPLGPFLSKNFATTISPWIVTMEALAPFRVALRAACRRPAAAAVSRLGAQPRARRDRHRSCRCGCKPRRCAQHGERRCCVSQSNFRDAYWTLAQLVAHHTVNGCNLQPGDLLGTGTQSGPNRRAGRLAARADARRQAADRARPTARRAPSCRTATR